MRHRFPFALLYAVIIAAPANAELADSDITKIVMLGTGTPNREPDRSGPAVAIVVNNTPYLVDFGPGVVRRAMSPSYGGALGGLETAKLEIAFRTLLHSDHVAGLADPILTPWVLGCDKPLQDIRARRNSEYGRAYSRGLRSRHPLSCRWPGAGQ